LKLKFSYGIRTFFFISWPTSANATSISLTLEFVQLGTGNPGWKRKRSRCTYAKDCHLHIH
jgi:hypothetical protein